MFFSRLSHFRVVVSIRCLRLDSASAFIINTWREADGWGAQGPGPPGPSWPEDFLKSCSFWQKGQVFGFIPLRGSNFRFVGLGSAPAENLLSRNWNFSSFNPRQKRRDELGMNFPSSDKTASKLKEKRLSLLIEHPCSKKEIYFFAFDGCKKYLLPCLKVNMFRNLENFSLRVQKSLWHIASLFQTQIECRTVIFSEEFGFHIVECGVSSRGFTHVIHSGLKATSLVNLQFWSLCIQYDSEPLKRHLSFFDRCSCVAVFIFSKQVLDVQCSVSSFRPKIPQTCFHRQFVNSCFLFVEWLPAESGPVNGRDFCFPWASSTEEGTCIRESVDSCSSF